jgi:hypothetical protein
MFRSLLAHHQGVQLLCNMAHHQRTAGTRTLTGQHRKSGPVRNEIEVPAAPKPCDTY